MNIGCVNDAKMLQADFSFNWLYFKAASFINYTYYLFNETVMKICMGQPALIPDTELN